MQKMYKGKPVTVLRPAREGDPGFNPPKPVPEKLLIRLQDGTQIVVASTELTDDPGMVPVMKAAPTAKSSTVITSTAAVTESSTKSFFGGIFKK